jgi:hypothetical protein
MDGDLSPRHVLAWTNLQLQQLPYIYLTKCSSYSSNINKVYERTDRGVYCFSQGKYKLGVKSYQTNSALFLAQILTLYGCCYVQKILTTSVKLHF